MIRWWNRLQRWWRYQRFLTAVHTQLTQGTGVTEQQWPQHTEVTTVLTWFEDQIVQARQPYGLHAVLLAIAPADASQATLEVTVSRQQPWSSVRETLRDPVAVLLATTPVKTATVAFGTAASTVLNQQKPSG